MDQSIVWLLIAISAWTACAHWLMRPRPICAGTRRRARGGLAASTASAALLVFGYAGTASAHPNVERDGGQIEGLVGGSNCLPGKVACRHDNDTLSGHTRGSFGGGVSLGWRAARWFFIGGAYRFGLLRPDYETFGLDADYRWGAQHTIVALARPILPIWRFDLGVNIGPGFSRQVFRYDDRGYDYTQGFTFLTGPTIDVFITRHMFLGFEADFIFNVHDKTCQRRGGDTTCHDGRRSTDLAPVHQVIYGLHVGGTFG
jgi:hypothetical protein